MGNLSFFFASNFEFTTLPDDENEKFESMKINSARGKTNKLLKSHHLCTQFVDNLRLRDTHKIKLERLRNFMNFNVHFVNFHDKTSEQFFICSLAWINFIHKIKKNYEHFCRCLKICRQVEIQCNSCIFTPLWKLLVWKFNTNNFVFTFSMTHFLSPRQKSRNEINLSPPTFLTQLHFHYCGSAKKSQENLPTGFLCLVIFCWNINFFSTSFQRNYGWQRRRRGRRKTLWMTRWHTHAFVTFKTMNEIYEKLILCLKNCPHDKTMRLEADINLSLYPFGSSHLFTSFVFFVFKNSKELHSDLLLILMESLSKRSNKWSCYFYVSMMCVVSPRSGSITNRREGSGGLFYQD